MWGVEIVVVLLATARLARLVAADLITEGLRQRAAVRLPTVAMLQHEPWCRWCVAVWVAVPVAAVWLLISDTPRVFGHWWADGPVVALALAYGCGLLARLED